MTDDRTVVIRTSDTDVLVIALANNRHISPCSPNLFGSGIVKQQFFAIYQRQKTSG